MTLADYYERTYGVTKAEVLRQLLRQGRRCAICFTEIAAKGKRIFHLDHDHATGLPRGLLCRGCNRLVGREERMRRVHGESLGVQLASYVDTKGVWDAN